MNIWYYTFGCKVNQYETDNVRQALENKGFTTVSDISDADISVINTCTVTSRSDLKFRKLLHKIKRINKDCIIVIAGCFPQAFAEEVEQMYECDIICGASNKSLIPEYIDEFLVHRQRIVSIPEHTRDEKFESMTNIKASDKTRAYIKIQDGCDQYCTYCIIPFARGHIRSKSLKDIKTEVEYLSKAGHKEIIIVGINLCCFGKDFTDGTRLVDAVELVCRSVGEQCRVRLGSIEPEMISNDDIQRLSQLENLCPQFHLSLQSGCDKTLKDMNRKYNTAEYKQLCDKLRDNFASCAITTDVMVGFPGESDEDFKKSLDFVNEIGFSKVHIFPYSERNGTVAAKRKDQIPKHIKEQRAAEMAKVCATRQHSFLQEMIGKDFPVLFERESSAEYHQGHTPNYTLVRVAREDIGISLRKQIRTVKIISVQKDHCIGEFVKEEY